MNIGQKGIALIKHFEGCRLTAYKCPAGIWTIGYGHTGYVSGKKIKEGMTITQQGADTLLSQDISLFVKAVNASLTGTITQNQFDALVSFAYNIGINAFKISTLLKLVNQKKFNLIHDEFLKWDKVNKKSCEGLKNRRIKESELFYTK